MSEVTLQDQEIIDLTKQVNTGDFTQFKITLPGTDRVLTSENMRRSDIKAAVLIKWCEFVREQMHVDYESMREEMEIKRQRRIKEEDRLAAEAVAAAISEEIAAKADGHVTGVLIEAQEDSEESKLILPTVGETADGNASASHVDNLWTTYGQLLGELEKVKAQLRAQGVSL